MHDKYTPLTAAIRKISLVIPVVFVIAVCGCGREKSCYNNSLAIMFVHYDSTDIDTFRLVKYPKVSSPVSQPDTMTITASKTYFQKYHDTIYVSSGQPQFMTQDFNWEIIVGQSLHGTKITDIINEQKTQRCGLLTMDCFTCNNRVVQYSINGQATQVVMDSRLGDYAVISK